MIEAQDWNDLTPDELEELEQSEYEILLVRRDDGTWAVITPFTHEDTASILQSLASGLKGSIH